MEYLLSFSALEFTNFRELEVRSLLELNGMPQECIDSNVDWTEPYVVVRCSDDEEASKLIERSVLIKSIYAIWTAAPTFEGVLKNIAQIPNELTENYVNGSNPIKIVVSSVHRKTSQEDRLTFINQLLATHKNMTAPISLASPAHHIYLLLQYTRSLTNLKEQKLRQVFYGRLICESARRRLINEFCLSKRAYLGNTTLDVRLSGLIANACLCRSGDIVWDPFIGTGGMVLATSVWGAFGGGCDINYSLVHGKDSSPKAGQGKRLEGECLRANYRQYGLSSRYLDVIIADAATLSRLLRTPTERLLSIKPSKTNDCRAEPVPDDFVGLFDAIITDPPYGVRERSRRVATQQTERDPSLVTPAFLSEISSTEHTFVADEKGLIPVPHDLPHFPHKEAYPLQESFADLLLLSVRLLRPNGRLVFWVPVDRKTYAGRQSLPSHPRLKLIVVCEQTLNSRVSRLLMVMEKLPPGSPDFDLSHTFVTESGDGAELKPWGEGVPFHLLNFREAYFKPRESPTEFPTKKKIT